VDDRITKAILYKPKQTLPPSYEQFHGGHLVDHTSKCSYIAYRCSFL